VKRKMSMGESYDVVVVGFGLAGAIAAIEAHDTGAKVLVIEKEGIPGGISICAGGGARIADNASEAFAYLKATCAGTTADSVLMALADGAVRLSDYVRDLAEPLGASTRIVAARANYPLPGYQTWSHIEVDHVPGFDPAKEYPHIRVEGDINGKNLFKVAHEHVIRRGITVRYASPVERLHCRNGEIMGVTCGAETLPARRAVVLACGGFEASGDLQRQFWPTPPMRPVATHANTGDGIRMAQMAGAGLWHMWHLHGVYGFHHPDPEFRFGIRVRRMRNWIPGVSADRTSPMSWIVVDRRGKRFMNEYDPYMQDTNYRPMALYDPVTQSYPRIPSVLVVDAKGRELSTICEPSYNDAATAARFNHHALHEFDKQVFVTRASLQDIAAEFDLDTSSFAATIEEWNNACAAGSDQAFGRPPSSMTPIAEPPFSAARVWPIVSNTQGGLPHDEQQRVLDAFGEPLRRLYVAGELGSVFGHLYFSGANYSECLIGGRIAGVNAAQLEPWCATA
jgi:succinate dehydrogenase/fumarate reductase flavoprotein subunit